MPESDDVIYLVQYWDGLGRRTRALCLFHRDVLIKYLKEKHVGTLVTHADKGAVCDACR